METIKSCLALLLFVNSVAVSNANWSAEGRVGFRLYRDAASSFIEEPMESGLKLFESSSYNKTLPMVILIHGMDADIECEFVVGSVKAMYFKEVHTKFNIFALNLPELLAKQSIYDKYLYTTAKNSEIAGDAIGEFLNRVIDLGYTTPEKIYIVGYSMGAQVAGYLARKVKDVHGLIQYIMGLDPAGIGFTKYTIASWFTRLVHVNAEDARYTHFVHCNSVGWGTLSREATANFVFNGGNFQPGCLADSNVACSHNRVPFYFIESILYPTGFAARKCDSWNLFSSCKCKTEDIRYVTFPPDFGANGTYNLHTNGHSFFGKGLEGVKCTKNHAKVRVIDTLKEQKEAEENLLKNAKHRTMRNQNPKLTNDTNTSGLENISKNVVANSKINYSKRIKKAKHKIKNKFKKHHLEKKYLLKKNRIPNK